MAENTDSKMFSDVRYDPSLTEELFQPPHHQPLMSRSSFCDQGNLGSSDSIHGWHVALHEVALIEADTDNQHAKKKTEKVA